MGCTRIVCRFKVVIRFQIQAKTDSILKSGVTTILVL